MTWQETGYGGYCALGVEWNESNASATTYTIAPTVWRWDYYSVVVSSQYFWEALYPEPNGSTGGWTGLPFTNGSGWRKVDTFGTRTYTKEKTSKTITLDVGTNAYFSSINNGGFYSIGEKTARFTLTIPAKTSYTVSFNANSGSGAPGSQTKWHGETLTLSSAKPTRTGYTFKGWATSQGSTTVAYQPGASYTGNANLSLYAVWQINTWLMTYKANGGSGSDQTQTKTYGTNATVKAANTFSRSNFTFKRWNTNTTDSGTAYNAGASYTANAAVTLYAIWNRTITYDANGGSGVPSNQTGIATSAITLSSTKPTRTNYVFKRWNTSTADTGTAYNPGGSYAANLANVTLYAIWNPIISFNANGGTGAPASQTKTYGTTLALSSTQPTRTGFSFKTWNTAANGSGTNYASGASYTANTAATLYAIWNHTLSFDANGGTGAPSAQTAVETSAITVPSTIPTRSGHTFLEWNTASDGSGTTYQPGDSYAANAASTTLYAKWRVDIVVTDIQCRVTNSNGDTDALGHHITVSASYDTTSSGNDCTYFGATLSVGGASEEKHAETTGATGTESFTFGPFTYDQITPLGGTAVGTLTASNSDGSIEFPLATAATGYKAPQISSVQTWREEDAQEADDGTDLGIALGWSIFQTPSQSIPVSITMELTDKQTGTVVCERTWTGVSDNPATFHVSPGFHLSADDEVVPGKSYFTGQDISTKVDNPTGSPVENGWYECDDILVDDELLNTARNYAAKFTVYDLWKSVVVTDEITVAYYTMDFLAGGHGAAFGKPSTREMFDVRMQAQFDMPIQVADQVSLPTYTFETTPSQENIPTGPAFIMTEDTNAVYYYDGTPDGTIIGGDGGSINPSDIDIQLPLSVSNGGTGATDATTALTNLGAASSSHTHSLSSLGAQPELSVETHTCQAASAMTDGSITLRKYGHVVYAAFSGITTSTISSRTQIAAITDSSFRPYAQTYGAISNSSSVGDTVHQNEGGSLVFDSGSDPTSGNYFVIESNGAIRVDKTLNDKSGWAVWIN